MTETLEEAKRLLERVLQEDGFFALSTEGFATMDRPRTPAQRLRDRADAIERRDTLIRSIRAFLGR